LALRHLDRARWLQDANRNVVATPLCRRACGYAGPHAPELTFEVTNLGSCSLARQSRDGLLAVVPGTRHLERARWLQDANAQDLTFTDEAAIVA
jgi:hypothetical protein